jgi:ATPase subunit of ABC transporter with duplicated ATPase domains
MFILQNINYIHPNRDLLFDNINLTVKFKEKVAIIGNNGVGKSTLLKIIAGQLPCSGGAVNIPSLPYYVPQILGRFDGFTVAQSIGIDEKLNALSEILSGNVTNENLSLLNDDWAIEERCNEALSYWQLDDLDLNSKMETLSGGQKTKVFLAGIKIHNPGILLLDEPTNHLDLTSRNLLYRFVVETSATVVVVSHDRILLNKLEKMCELTTHGIKIYGGNYEFYKEQKAIENIARINHLEEKQKTLRKAKEIEREALERQQKQNDRGKKQQKKERTPKIMMDKMKNDAEKSAARLKGIHVDKINTITQELNNLRKETPDRDKIKFGFDNSALHKGKILVKAVVVNFAYGKKMIWKNPLYFQIISSERIVINGDNGSGKTTLLRLILGNIVPTCGTIFRADSKTIYIDQDYSLLSPELSVYEQAQTFNDTALQEYEVKIRLNRFLFTKDFWDKPCNVLSGGEKMRLLLCCLTLSGNPPDMIVLDEPTNNLDIQNTEILTTAVNEYRGTLVVVSHDPYFLKQINIERQIDLNR